MLGTSPSTEEGHSRHIDLHEHLEGVEAAIHSAWDVFSLIADLPADMFPLRDNGPPDVQEGLVDNDD